MIVISFAIRRNRQTIKGVNFFGPCSEFIMSGSDCGNFFIWDKNSEAIVQWLPGDENGVVNCLESHPHFPIIATSGLDHDIKIWGPMKEHPDGVCNSVICCLDFGSKSILLISFAFLPIHSDRMAMI